MNKESKGKCKYCHLSGHIIDKCPTIICKHCKAIGHPNWLCKNNPNAENIKNPLSPNLQNKKSIYAFDSTNSLSKEVNTIDSIKEVNTIDSIKEESNNSFVISSIDINNNTEVFNGSFKKTLFKDTLKNNQNNQKNIYTGFKQDFKQKENKIKENKVKQNEVKQNEVKQNEVKQNEVKQNEVKENKVKENEVKENKVKENEVKENEVKENEVKFINIKYYQNIIDSKWGDLIENL